MEASEVLSQAYAAYCQVSAAEASEPVASGPVASGPAVLHFAKQGRYE